MLSTKDLSLSYGSKVILDKANLTLLKQEKIALVGQNGEGKSTLLKLLAGHLEPDDGSIKLASKATIGFLEQEPKFNPNASIIDVVSSGLNKQEFEEQKYKIDRILSKLKIHHAQDTLVRILSGGEKRRVDLASILISEPDVYLLDEPTNHLDFESISYLENFLKSTHAPILFISHDKTFIDNTANKILELDKSKFYSHEPPYQNYLENKLVRQDISSKTQHRKEQLLKTELAWLKAGVKARTTKQNAHIGRVYDLQDSVEFGKSFNQNKQVDIKIAKSSRLQKTILELDGIGFGYDSENTLFSNLTLKFKQGDRIGLIGPNGSGKTYKN